ncbi:MAG TPA: efflux RND transporter periplasmic adaptor subunit [Desulfobulbus sp.]|nr:efflux RND transporter periplasmic adaptor subunit [Desulfobulbus sp.]
MKKDRTLGWIMIPLLAALALLLLSARGNDRRSLPESEAMGMADFRDFQVTVRTIGVLQAAQSYMVSSQIRGSDAKIIYLVGDGSRVTRGEVLVRFDPAPFEEAVETLEARVESLGAAVEAAKQMLAWKKSEVEQQIATADYNRRVAGLELKRLKDGDGPLSLAQYRDEMDKAAMELKRYQGYLSDLESLRGEGFDNPAELERARENITVFRDKFTSAKRRYDSYRQYVLPSLVEAARAKVENAELTVRQTRQAGVHLVARAAAGLQEVEGKLQGARAALKQAQAELAKTEIRAPFDGLVILYETYRDGQLRKPREGDSVIINQPILYLPDISTMEVKGRVREVDLHKIALGQEATITLEAFPRVTFTGRLAFIGALAARRRDQRSGDKYFQVSFSMDESDPRLRPGMTARVVIHAARLSRVLSVPVQSVFREADRVFVYRWTGNAWEERPVTPGRRNDYYVEILDGLQAGDRVALVRPLSR